jgi:SAM-dependent methyltransferase
VQTDASVRDFYDQSVAFEWRRLVTNPLRRLEFETTQYFLKKYLPPSGLLLDAGGGPGRYTIEMAKLGYDVILYDLSPANLAFARRQIARSGVKRRIKEVDEGSIVDLSRFPAAQFDAVLCLGGPLSHVDGTDRRLQAVRELTRIAKPGAPVFISVMGRLSVLRQTPRYMADWIGTESFREAWQAGDHRLWYRRSFCHFFLPDEF